MNDARESPNGGLISRGAELQALVQRLLACEVVAIDAEMDSFFSYRTKLCLIQVSSPEEDVLIDPLADVDLSPLQQVLDNPRVLKIFHAGDNDIPYLIERIGGRVGPIFDTHLAARILGMPRSGLGGLLEDLLGLQVDKRFQRADWRTRPLPSDQLEYALGDTRYLITLYRMLEERLAEAGLQAEASASFQRVRQIPPEPRQFNPQSYLQVAGVARLNHSQKARLFALFRWRDELARQRDEAVFRVLSDTILLNLALPQPNAAEVRNHFRYALVRERAQELLELLEAAQEVPPMVVSAAVLKGRALVCYDRLRTWRNQLAESLGVECGRVLSNRTLKALVLAAPVAEADLAQVEGLEEWRLAKFGAALWLQLQELKLSRPD